MAYRVLNMIVRQKLVEQLPRTNLIGRVANVHTLEKIGNRDIVGYGCNGTAAYEDRLDYPLPAIRFREATNEIKLLREKEKGDWKKLTMQEKKALYRHSFCQTFAEMQAGTGEWKQCVGLSLICLSAAFWVLILMNLFVYDEMPPSFDDEHKKAQMRRMIDLEVNPVTGISSKWDYERNTWKK